MTAQKTQESPNREPMEVSVKRFLFAAAIIVVAVALTGVISAQHAQPLGVAAFGAIVPEAIDWKSFSAFPRSVRLAVLVGQPSDKGLYAVRVKVPQGVKILPHRHPEDRIYTVISGVFYIGLGDQFDAGKLQAYSPGSVIMLPGKTSHFHWAKSGEYVTQVSAIGPLGIEYVNSADDPRNHKQGGQR